MPRQLGDLSRLLPMRPNGPRSLMAMDGLQRLSLRMKSRLVHDLKELRRRQLDQAFMATQHGERYPQPKD